MGIKVSDYFDSEDFEKDSIEILDLLVEEMKEYLKLVESTSIKDVEEWLNGLLESDDMKRYGRVIYLSDYIEDKEYQQNRIYDEKLNMYLEDNYDFEIPDDMEGSEYMFTVNLKPIEYKGRRLILEEMYGQGERIDGIIDVDIYTVSKGQREHGFLGYSEITEFTKIEFKE